MDETIIVHRSTTGYEAEFFGATAIEVRRLFGTAVLPTAFTPEAEPEFVRDEIAGLNPGVQVYACQCCDEYPNAYWTDEYAGARPDGSPTWVRRLECDR